MQREVVFGVLPSSCQISASPESAREHNGDKQVNPVKTFESTVILMSSTPKLGKTDSNQS